MCVSVACEIRQWLSDIHLMDDSGRYKMRLLCYAYNWASSPSKLRSDDEHRACRRLARYCWKRLESLPGWHEMDNGRLWC